MARREILVLAGMIMLFPSTGYAQTESEVGAPSVVTVTAPALPPAGTVSATPPVADPDPAYGDQLPAGWMTPQYFIPRPRQLGLSTPAPGFGWSRYGKLAVLTDQWGRIYSAESRVKWGQLGKVPSRIRPDTMRYPVHWQKGYVPGAVTTSYEEVRTTRVIPGAVRREKRTTYEWMAVPAKRAVRPAKRRLPRR